jgi:putative SOS response-associated peptidase YedK
MCGRFTQSYTWRELTELYRLAQPARNLRPRYNIAPTTAVDVVRPVEGGLAACRTETLRLNAEGDFAVVGFRLALDRTLIPV